MCRSIILRLYGGTVHVPVNTTTVGMDRRERGSQRYRDNRGQRAVLRHEEVEKERRVGNGLSGPPQRTRRLNFFFKKKSH